MLYNRPQWPEGSQSCIPEHFHIQNVPFIQSSPWPNWPVLLQTQLQGCTGSVPASPEDCWNTCCVKHQPGHTETFWIKGSVWTNNSKYWFKQKRTWLQKNNPKVSREKKETAWSILDYSMILLGFSQILSPWQQVITWHFLAQHEIVPNVIRKIEQYTVVALLAGINISRG